MNQQSKKRKISSTEKINNENLASSGDKSDHLFWSTFIGEYVQMLGSIVNPLDGTGLPLNIQGYLLDYDENYYYVGHNPIEIDSAIKRKDISMISIHEPTDPTLEVLQDMPEPETDEDIN